MARKYGARFREFIGGEIEVRNAQPVKSFVEVHRGRRCCAGRRRSR